MRRPNRVGLPFESNAHGPMLNSASSLLPVIGRGTFQDTSVENLAQSGIPPRMHASLLGSVMQRPLPVTIVKQTHNHGRQGP
jgi:hypothetical protein